MNKKRILIHASDATDPPADMLARARGAYGDIEGDLAPLLRHFSTTRTDARRLFLDFTMPGPLRDRSYWITLDGDPDHILPECRPDLEPAQDALLDAAGRDCCALGLLEGMHRARAAEVKRARAAIAARRPVYGRTVRS